MGREGEVYQMPRRQAGQEGSMPGRQGSLQEVLIRRVRLYRARIVAVEGHRVAERVRFQTASLSA